jgi:hypothetical protein
MNVNKTINLTNITISQKKDINNNDYFIIFDNNEQQAYFCFSRVLKKENWEELVNNYQSIREIELEFEETEKGKKVISLFIIRKENDIFIQ